MFYCEQVMIVINDNLVVSERLSDITLVNMFE